MKVSAHAQAAWIKNRADRELRRLHHAAPPALQEPLAKADFVLRPLNGIEFGLRSGPRTTIEALMENMPAAEPAHVELDWEPSLLQQCMRAALPNITFAVIFSAVGLVL